MIDNIVDQLIRDEGERLEVYYDTEHVLTAGVGHNLEAHRSDLNHKIPWQVGMKITQAQSRAWLIQDIQDVSIALNANLPFVWDLNVPRRGVFQNMCFNMGINRLMGFVNTIAAAKGGDHARASAEMLKSKWAMQVGLLPPSDTHPEGGRAWRLSQQMLNGVWV